MLFLIAVYPLAAYSVGLAVRSIISTLILQGSLSTPYRLGIFVFCDLLSLAVHLFVGFSFAALYLAPHIQQLLELHDITGCQTFCTLYWSTSGLADLLAIAAILTAYSVLVRRRRTERARIARKARFICTYVVLVLSLGITNYWAYALISSELRKLDMGFPRD